jgi:hypothetical protein
MGHRITGFIAVSEGLCVAASGLTNPVIVPLRHGFSFLPLSKSLVGDGEPMSFEVFDRLTERLRLWAEEHSKNCPLAYIETDYFGGVGAQSAIAWADGKVVFGPVLTRSTSAEPGAINRALQQLGVQRVSEWDEFDTVGLGWHRSNEAWLAERTA